MNNTIKGSIYGIISAVCYGLNPLGALLLYELNVNSVSVLLYRFVMAIAILACIMIFRKESFKITRHETSTTATLGLLFALSSISLYTSFMFIDAGIACTILFIYPVMVAIMMTLFYGERMNLITILSILLTMGGIALLYKGDGSSSIDPIGFILVFISSLTYAIYIIVVNKSKISMSPIKLNFFVMIFCSICIALFSFVDFEHGYTIGASSFMLPPSLVAWGYGLMLAIGPAVLSLVFMTLAIKYIGSTPTAIMGALEPVTAVIIGITIFGEILTTRLTIGILLIMTAVMMIILSKSSRLRNPLKRIIRYRKL